MFVKQLLFILSFVYIVIHAEDEAEIYCKRFVENNDENNGFGVKNISIVIPLVTQPNARIRQILHLDNDNRHGYIEYKMDDDPGTCARLSVQFVQVNEFGKSISNEKDAELVTKATFVIGQPVLPVLMELLYKTESLIMAVDPLSSNLEKSYESNLAEPSPPIYTDLISSMWSSTSQLSDMVAMNIQLLNIHNKGRTLKVFMIVYARASENSIEKVDVLETSILKYTKAVVKIFDLYLTYVRLENMKETEDRFANIYATTTTIRNMIKQFEPDVIVLSLDLPTDKKLKIINLLFSKGADLDDVNVPWILADMFFEIEENAKKELLKVFTKTKLYFFEHLAVYSDSKVAYRRAGPTLPNGIVAVGIERAKNIILHNFKRLLEHASNQEEFLIGLRKTLHLDSDAGQWISFPDVIALFMIDRDQALTETGVTSVTNFKKEMEASDIRLPSDGAAISNDKYIIAGSNEHLEKMAVVVVPEWPIAFHLDDCHNQDETCYDGLAIDIFKAVKLELLKDGTDIELRFVDNKFYGSEESSGVWSGAIGSLRTGESVLGLGMFSVTEQREKLPDIEFTTPYAYTYMTAIFKKWTAFYLFFQIVRPFSLGVWMCLTFVMVASGFYLFIIDMWNPFKENRNPENVVNLQESLWHSYLTITQTGAPFGARLLPTRIYTIIFWLFGCIVVGCYTGNLASFLSESSYFIPDTWASIVDGELMSYTLVLQSNSSYTDTNRVGNKDFLKSLKKYKVAYVDNNTQGVELTKGGYHVFYGGWLGLLPHERRDESCTLSTINYRGSYTSYQNFLMATERVAFPMHKDWQLRKKFSLTMQNLKERGALQKFYYKWIEGDHHCLEEDDKDSDHKRLDTKNFAGLFVLVGIGTVVGFVLLAIKLTYLKLKQRQEEKNFGDKVPENKETLNTAALIPGDGDGDGDGDETNSNRTTNNKNEESVV